MIIVLTDRTNLSHDIKRFTINLLDFKMLQSFNTLQFIPNPLIDKDKTPIVYNYKTAARVSEIFDEILQNLEDGKSVYRVPEK